MNKIIEDFFYDSYCYKIRKPLTLEVSLDESEQLYFVCYDELALNVASDTRDALLEDIHEKLAFLWLFYIETDHEHYGGDVELLRSNLLSFMEKSNG